MPSTTCRPPSPLRSEVKKNIYLTHPLIDLFTAGGGLSLILFPFFFFLSGFERSPEIVRLALWASFLINYPHFAATIYRLYHNRENRTAYWFTAYAAPAIFAVLFGAALIFPHSFGSWYTKAFLLWSGYHYSGQTLGISLIYARRSGFPVSSSTRLLFAAATYSSYLYPIIRAETGPGPFPYFGISVPSFHLPDFCGSAAFVLLAVSWAAFLMHAVYSPRYHSGRWIPAGVFLPILAQFCWYLPGSYVPNFYEFVPLFHGLQYLLVVWFFQMKEVKETYAQKQTVFSGWNYGRENLKYGLALMALGALLFRWIPDGLAFLGIPLTIAEPLWIATVQLHHFWSDGIIWRLRNQQVGSKLLPLSTSPWAEIPKHFNTSLNAA